MQAVARTWRSSVVVATALAGCSGPLPSPSVIDKLRLLTITASEPNPATPSHSDALVGQSLRVRAVWADGKPDATRPIYFFWHVCAEGTDNDPRDCLASPSTGNDLGPAAIGRDDVVIAPSDLPAATSVAGVTTYFVILVMCPNAAPTFDASMAQYACPSEASLPNDQREGIQAFRRLVVRAAPPLNENPTIAHVTIAGMDPDVDASLTVDHCTFASDGTPMCNGMPLILTPSPGSAEIVPADAGDGGDADAGVTYESLLASFFVTGGATDRPRAVANTNAPNGEDGALRAVWYPNADAGPATVWFTLHDGRGGDVARSVGVTVR